MSMNSAGDTGCYIAGVDIGTQSIRAIVLGPGGEEIAVARRSLSPRFGPSGAAEQDVDELWEAFSAVLWEVAECGDVAENLLGLGLCTTNPTLILTGSGHVAVHPAILWADQRAQREAQGTREGLVSHLGWLSEQPDIRDIHEVFECSTWLAWRLTEKISVSTAISDLSWGNGAAVDAGIHALVARNGIQVHSKQRHKPTEIVGFLTSEVKAQLGLSSCNRPIAVAVPGNDGFTHAMGAGLGCGGIGAVEVGGSSYVVFEAPCDGLLSPSAILDKPGRLKITNLSNAGLELLELKENLTGSWDELSTSCLRQLRTLGCSERSPVAGSVPPKVNEDVLQLLRFFAGLAWEAEREGGASPHRKLVLSGGFSRDPVFVQFRSVARAVCQGNSTGDLLATADPSTGARGAAAMVAAGIWGDTDKWFERFRPQLETVVGDREIGRVALRMFGKNRDG